MDQHSVTDSTTPQGKDGMSPLTPSHLANGHEAGANTAPALRSVADTGLDMSFLVDLVSKSCFVSGKTTLLALMDGLKLPLSVLDELIAFTVREHLMEITHRGALDADVHVRLTDAGHTRAREAMNLCSYVGPAPVTLDAYVTSVKAHSVRKLQVKRTFVKQAFKGTTLDSRLLDEIASSLNAARPLMLFGPAGSGKTYLAERLGTLLQGAAPIPFAISVSGEVIQVFDPLVHVPVADASVAGQPHLRDRRWLWCERPLVISGGELTLDMLEVCYDASTGFYQAPPHMKANGGIYIIDDFGRQMAPPQALANRWIVPLDRNIDVHTLHTGRRFIVPFDVWPVFSSNLNPWELCDEPFLRRLGCKLYVGAMEPDAYRRIFDAECRRLGLAAGDDAFDYLTQKLHGMSATPLMACYPRDLLLQVEAECRYMESAMTVTADLLDDAWRRYFDMNHRGRRSWQDDGMRSLGDAPFATPFDHH